MQGRGHAGTCEGTASYRTAKMRNGKARRRWAKAMPRFAWCLNAMQRRSSAENSGATAMNCKGKERMAQQRRGIAKQWIATQRQATAWQIIEGYAQLRRSNECKAGEGPSNAMFRSGNELRSNEQKSKRRGQHENKPFSRGNDRGAPGAAA